MRCLLTLFVAGSLLTLLSSCSVTPQAATAPTPGPTKSPFTKVEESINPEGWPIPIVQAEKKEKTKRKEKQADGTELWVTATSYRPTERVVGDLPPIDGKSEWIITDVVELSFNSARPFCYEYWVTPYQIGGNAMAVIFRYRICDRDGDGIYEFKGGASGSVAVPSWAK